jgi:Cft2 family RNA processing exonuclease
MATSFTNLTRANEIGANSYALDFDGRTLLLDAGMHPKLDGRAALPDLSPVFNRNVEAIFVSHAHHDHIGALPVVMQEHPDARVFMSEPTYFLADPLLHNSVNVMKRQREELGIVEYPLYGHKELHRLVETWQACHLDTPWSLEGYPKPDREELTFRFHHAGHILGSVAIELVHRGRRILYTGDINFSEQTVMTPARLPAQGIDTLIIETTRGAQPTPSGYSRGTVVQRFFQSIRDTFERGGAVMIPIFAMGKTQEVLTLLHHAMERKELPRCPIFIGGLSRVFTQVYDKLADRSERNFPSLRMLEDIQPEMMDGRKATGFRPRKSQIYLISSGMMTENTLSNLIARQMLARENDSILFVGYTDPESPAGRLRQTPRGGRVTLSRAYGDQPVLCHVDYFDLTAHALREDILVYIQNLQPRRCFLVHGDLPAQEWFRDQLAASHPDIEVVIPPPGREIPL